jgi:bla regulator protein blaR1
MTVPEVLLILSSSPELSILVKATVLLALGLTVMRLARRATASARHVILGATFASVLALPLVIAIAPRFRIELPIASASGPQAAPVLGRTAGRTSTIASPAQQGWAAPSWSSSARALWVGGLMLQFLYVGLHLLRVRRLRRGGIPWLERTELIRSLAIDCGVRRRVDILLHEGIAAPITCGAINPAILLPSDACEWGYEDLRRAVIHELEHVRRNDWATQLAARATLAFYWFHPLAWAAWRRFCLEAERTADDAVLRHGESTEYAEQLVSLARRMSNTQAQPALGMANRSDLSARVSALLDSTQQRGPAGFLTAAGAIAIAGMVLIGLAPLTAVAQSSGTPRASRLDRALYEAAQAGDLQDIDTLLNAGANANAAIGGDGSPLIGAARRGQLAAVARLLDRGADPNMPVSGDGNPLIMAASAGHADVVALLLDRGARVDEVVPRDENALIQASGKGRLDVVKLLVARRANVNARLWVEESGIVGVVGGAVGGVPGGVPGGVVGGAQRSGEWRSPLNMARKGGYQAVVDFLIASGARE